MSDIQNNQQPQSNTPPYIRDPKNPRCGSCSSDIYVQADESSKAVTIGKETKQHRVFTVRQEIDRSFPTIMSACKC